MSNNITIKRSELHQLVWREPMIRLAKNYGMSDVGLAKICRKHDIPCPPRGYWAQKQHGQEPSQVPLPRPDDDVAIELRDLSNPMIASAVLRKEAVGKTADDQQEEFPIVVADTLRGAHELVSRANQELQGARTGPQGLIIATEQRPSISRPRREACAGPCSSWTRCSRRLNSADTRSRRGRR